MNKRLKEIGELVGKLEAAADDTGICGVDCGRTGSCNVDYLLYDAADFIKELLTMVDEREWQPIETAPRDGKIIILTDGFCTYAAWSDGDSKTWDIADDFGEPNGIEEKYVTGWMPLPEPPEQDNE